MDNNTPSARDVCGRLAAAVELQPPLGATAERATEIFDARRGQLEVLRTEVAGTHYTYVVDEEPPDVFLERGLEDPHLARP